MTPDELRELGEDIKANGLQAPIRVRAEKTGVEWTYQLLDGRNRLDAIELAGFDPVNPPKYKGKSELHREGRDCGLQLSLGLPLSFGLPSFTDISFVSGLDEDEAFAFVISANIHRRHLTADQKRELITKLIKATPEKSDRAIAATVKASPTTVGTVRAKMEAKGEVSRLDTRIDAKGVKQPATKLGRARAAKHFCWQCGRRGKVGEVQEHRFPAYGDADIWLHETCIVAFTEQQQREAVARPPSRDDIGADSAAEAARLRVVVHGLQAEKRRLELKIRGLESEVEELRGKLKAGADMSIGEFQVAIKKWEETVQVQRGIIARLENDNVKLRAGVSPPPADPRDPGPFPAFLLRSAP
jgi:hypothetical protein